MSEFALLLTEILKFIIASQSPWDEESSFVLVENKCISSPFFQWQRCGNVLLHKEKQSAEPEYTFCTVNHYFASIWL